MSRVRIRVAPAASLLIAMLGVAYLASRFFRPEFNGMDFRLLWLAGDLWRDGQSPYGAAFLSAYRAQWGEGPPMHFWVYPPQWFGIVSVLAMLPFRPAFIAWSIVTMLLTLASAWLLGRAFATGSPQTQRLSRAGLVAWLCVAEATLWNFSIGQTAAITLIALSLLAYGDRFDLGWARVAGLLLLTLKPNIGVPIFCFYVARDRQWREIAGAVGLCVLLALPSLLLFGFAEIWGLLEAIQRYGAPEMWANDFSESTSLVQLVSFAGIYSSSVVRTTLLIASVTAGFALGVAARGRKDGYWLACLVLALLILVPLHSYDQMLFALPLAYALMRRDGLWLAGGAGLVLLRPLKLATLGLYNSHTTVFQDSLLYLIIAIALLAGLVWLHRASPAPRPAIEGKH